MNDHLIARLDPNRSYGDRDYDEIVEGVRGGRLRLEGGRRWIMEELES